MKHRRTFFFVCLAVLSVSVIVQSVFGQMPGGFEPKDMDFDTLMFHASRYGNTEERRTHKKAAKKELMSRGPDALAYLVRHTYMENMWFFIYARELVERLDKEEAVPVLLEAIGSPHDDVRKHAAYFLGFHTAPEHADHIVPLVETEETRGAAIRTLGKWRVTNAVGTIIPFLQDEKERIRVLAANALGDIGDPAAGEALIRTLDDRFFTVRRSASRALARIGHPAVPLMAEAVRAEPETPRLRALIRTLGEMEDEAGLEIVEAFLQHNDPGVRYEARQALEARTD